MKSMVLEIGQMKKMRKYHSDKKGRSVRITFWVKYNIMAELEHVNNLIYLTS